VRTPKESQPARGTDFLLSVERGTGQDIKKGKQWWATHILLSIEGGTNEDNERRQAREGHSHSAKCRKGRHKSECQN